MKKLVKDLPGFPEYKHDLTPIQFREYKQGNGYHDGFNEALDLIGNLQQELEAIEKLTPDELFAQYCKFMGRPEATDNMIDMEGLAGICGYIKGKFGTSAVGMGKQGITPLQWFMTPNPLLGDVSPIEMIRNGRGDKLCKWIKNQVDENNHTSLGTKEVDEKEIYQVCFNMCQAFDSATQTGCEWSDWDKEQREKLGKIVEKLYVPPQKH